MKQETIQKNKIKCVSCHKNNNIIIEYKTQSYCKKCYLRLPGVECYECIYDARNICVYCTKEKP
jgi:hypothetical protein